MTFGSGKSRSNTSSFHVSPSALIFIDAYHVNFTGFFAARLSVNFRKDERTYKHDDDNALLFNVAG